MSRVDVYEVGMRYRKHGWAFTFCSRKDKFNPRAGEREALKKFMSMMPWTREDRTKVWKAWLNR